MGIKRDIEYAIYMHGSWKAHFRNFLNGKAGMNLSAIGEPHACKLGKWLENEAYRMLSPEDYAEACRLHEEFHQVSSKIVDSIKQKDFQAAHAAIASAGSFDQASHELAAFLRKLAYRRHPVKNAVEMPPEAAAAAQAAQPRAA